MKTLKSIRISEVFFISILQLLLSCGFIIAAESENEIYPSPRMRGGSILHLHRRLENDCSPATFRVNGKEVIMNGEIVTGTEHRLFKLLEKHPKVDTLVLQNVPGSCDDTAMIKLGKRVHRSGLKTLLPSDGFVASGGSDLLLAGVERHVDSNGCIGIHSWCCDDRTDNVADLPVDDSVHQPYIEYYKSVGYSPQKAAYIYWLTITSAPSGGMHYLTPREVSGPTFGFENVHNSPGRCHMEDEGGNYDYSIPPAVAPTPNIPAPIPAPTKSPILAPTNSPVIATDPPNSDNDNNDAPTDDDDAPTNDDDGDLYWD